jgi:hypothetical protein
MLQEIETCYINRVCDTSTAHVKCLFRQGREALAQDEERRRQDEAEAAERFAMVQAELARGR